MAVRDLTGKVFGRWTVLSFAGKGNHGSMWLCRCDCGEQREVFGPSLIKGSSTGCLHCGNKTHGMAATRIFGVWGMMMQRCHNPNNKKFYMYGGRGIKVCERWHSFEAFLADMGEAPPGCSLDRYPNQNGNYEPGNVRWATRTEQQRNTRANRLLTFRGEMRCLAEWSMLLGMTYKQIDGRLRRGWSVDEALGTPADIWKRQRQRRVV